MSRVVHDVIREHIGHGPTLVRPAQGPGMAWATVDRPPETVIEPTRDLVRWIRA